MSENNYRGEKHPEGSRKKGVKSSDESVYKSSGELGESVYLSSEAAEASVYQKSADREKDRRPQRTSVLKKKFENICDACDSAGEIEEAHGFCINCNQYLCQMCYDSHTRNKVSQDHVLLNEENMPKKSLKLCDPCKERGGGAEEEAAGFCTDCNEYLCNVCFMTHRTNRVSKSHKLLDKDDMPIWSDSDLSTSVAKMKISKKGTDSEKYNEKYTMCTVINAKTTQDEKNCFIRSMTVVTNTKLVLTDVYNESLKVVDLENNIIKDSLVLESFPGGITKISKHEVAVVLQKTSLIQIISVSGRLYVVRNLEVHGFGVDINYTNGKLYVSCRDPVKFVILDLSGEVSKIIRPDFETQSHFTPRYIAVSPDESMIYVSDFGNNKVLCIDMNGNMLSMIMYQGQLHKPCGVTISPSGSVFLCCKDQHIIYKMTSDLREAIVMIGQWDDLMYPQALCFDEKQLLYISSSCDKSQDRNSIKVYKRK